MKFDFYEIKNKYLLDTDSKVFVGNAEEIKTLILTVEDQAEDLKLYKNSLKESKEREAAYIDDIQQMEGMLLQANERIKQLEANDK
jgi:hypothetical protein